MSLSRHMQRAHAAQLRQNARKRAILTDRIIQTALDQRRFIQLTGRRDPGLANTLYMLTTEIVNLGASTSDLHAIGRRVNQALEDERQ